MEGLVTAVGLARRSTRRDDRGDSYIEILVTLVIVSITVVAIIGALLTSIQSSTEHRNLATDDNVIKSAVEVLKAATEQQDPSKFIGCSATQTSTSILSTWNSGGAQGIALPGNATIAAVQCWDGANSRFVTCTSNCGSYQTYGLLLVTVQSEDSSHYTVSLSTIIRDPSYNAAY